MEESFEDCSAPAAFEGNQTTDALSIGRRHLRGELHRGAQGRTRVLRQQVSIGYPAFKVIKM